MERTTRRFGKLLFFSGIFNIVMASPLIFPVLYERYFHLLWQVNQFFHLGGKRLIPPTEAINALLVNTAGIDLVLIGVIVCYAGLDPMRRTFIPFANAIGRTLFAGIIIYYCLVFDIARLVLVIGGIDVLISAGFGYYLIKLKRLQEDGGQKS
ncbi:MAG: hypothetical protein ABIL58_17810 [Pseudomonadota bacterium]